MLVGDKIITTTENNGFELKKYSILVVTIIFEQFNGFYAKYNNKNSKIPINYFFSNNWNCVEYELLSEYRYKKLKRLCYE